MTARVDVIIATKDRPGPLRSCLQTLAGQTFGDFGVIIVDDGSLEPVSVQPEDARIGAGPVVVVRNERSLGPAASRNRGVSRGNAPHLLFLDDDSLVAPDLVGRHHAVLSRFEGQVVSFGPILPPPGKRLKAWNQWEADRLAREYSKLEQGEEEPSWMHLYTGNLALQRSDFEAAGGFDPGFTRQEDVELGLRLWRAGCRFVFEPSAVVWHDTNRSLDSWLSIPVASAYHDLLIEESFRQDGVRFVQERLRQKHWLLRLARRALCLPLIVRSAVAMAVALGRVLYALRLERLSLLAFSLVWDLQYTTSLRRATSDHSSGARA